MSSSSKTLIVHKASLTSNGSYYVTQRIKSPDLRVNKVSTQEEMLGSCRHNGKRGIVEMTRLSSVNPSLLRAATAVQLAFNLGVIKPIYIYKKAAM